MALVEDLDGLMDRTLKALAVEAQRAAETIQRPHMPRHRITARVERGRVVVSLSNWVGTDTSWPPSAQPRPERVKP